MPSIRGLRRNATLVALPSVVAVGREEGPEKEVRIVHLHGLLVERQLGHALPCGRPRRVRRLQANAGAKANGPQRDPDRLRDARRLGSGGLVRREQSQARVDRSQLGQQPAGAGEVERECSPASRDAHAPGGSQPAYGSAHRPRVGWTSAGSSASATAWRTALRLVSPRSVRSARSPTRHVGAETTWSPTAAQAGGAETSAAWREPPAPNPASAAASSATAWSVNRRLDGASPRQLRRGLQHEALGGELDRPVRPGPDSGIASARDSNGQTRMGEDREQRGVWLRQQDLDGTAVAAPDLPDETTRAAERANPRGRARGRLVRGNSLGERGDDVVEPEDGAVVKLDVRTQPEAPEGPARNVRELNAPIDEYEGREESEGTRRPRTGCRRRSPPRARGRCPSRSRDP